MSVKKHLMCTRPQEGSAKSCWNLSTSSSVSIGRRTKVSSAYTKVSLRFCISSGKSFSKHKNISCRKVEPCRTSLANGKKPEWTASTTKLFTPFTQTVTWEQWRRIWGEGNGAIAPLRENSQRPCGIILKHAKKKTSPLCHFVIDDKIHSALPRVDDQGRQLNKNSLMTNAIERLTAT